MVAEKVEPLSRVPDPWAVRVELGRRLRELRLLRRLLRLSEAVDQERRPSASGREDHSRG
jgi:hypothetical protein